MRMADYRLAIDIGASSGRGIIGYRENGHIQTMEIYRFANGVEEKDGHLVWNIDYIYQEVKKTIKIAIQAFDIKSLSIDTWGVDYVLLNDAKEISPCYAYRDNRTHEVVAAIESILPFKELYARTGCQFQAFNTVYQLYDDLKKGRLEQASDFLMIPEYLIYRLTGKKVKEFTNATTTGLVNKDTARFDKDIINKLGLPKHLFPQLMQPGTIVGDLKEDVVNFVGKNCKVVLCATHDTASAVEGIPLSESELYISSGTWSLLGTKTSKPIADKKSMLTNFSNEGGVGYNRYQKNIMGLWIVQNLKKELCCDKHWDEITDMASKSCFEETIDCENRALLSPHSMKTTMDSLLHTKPANNADYFRCAYKSLAFNYKKAIDELEANTGKKYKKIFIVGGGAKNKLLNKMTECYTKKEVVALPIEATAIGNLKLQLEVKDELSRS